MIKRVLTLVNAVNIIPRISINDDAGPEAGPAHGSVAQPVGRGLSRGNRGNNADAHLKRQVMGREVVVTNGRLDLGTWEQIFFGEFDGRRRKRVLVKSRRHSFGIIGE
jgi:hypothetical protein